MVLLKKLLRAGEFPIPTSLNLQIEQDTHLFFNCTVFPIKTNKSSHGKGSALPARILAQVTLCVVGCVFSSDQKADRHLWHLQCHDLPQQSLLQFPIATTRWREGTELGPWWRLRSPCTGRNTFVSLLFFLPLCSTSPFSGSLSLRCSCVAFFSAPQFKESRPGLVWASAGWEHTGTLALCPPAAALPTACIRSQIFAQFFSNVTQPWSGCSCLIMGPLSALHNLGVVLFMQVLFF